MKRGMLLAASLLVVASMAFAQAGSVGVFSDAAATSCDITDAVSGVVIVYIVHVSSPATTGSQFIVDADPGFTATYIAETVTAPFLKIGTCAGPTATGCAIAYGGCEASPIMMLTIQYFGTGTSTPCSMFHIREDPSADPPGLYVTDCADPPNLLTGLGGEAIVNFDGVNCDPCNVPNEDTSWGTIQAIYQ
jgi:hypothetical protein